MIILVDACARQHSRTRMLAQAVIEHMPGSVERVDLFRQGLLPLDGETLAKREALIGRTDYSDDICCFSRQRKPNKAPCCAGRCCASAGLTEYMPFTISMVFHRAASCFGAD